MKKRDVFIKGIYRDILKRKDETIIYDSGWASNTIVDRCRMLLAGFMKNDPSDGIQYLAVGRGLQVWDTTGAPVPNTATTTNLIDRFDPPIQVSDLVIVYLNDDETTSTTPTTRLQITATLPTNYPTPETYPLREFGLFGRLNGTDFMINNIRHPVIHKDGSSTLIREIRLSF